MPLQRKILQWPGHGILISLYMQEQAHHVTIKMKNQKKKPWKTLHINILMMEKDTKIKNFTFKNSEHF